MKITELQSHSLRGIPASWPPVQIGDKGLVITGPNGVGKSSLIDALEFALTGKSSLYSAARQGVNWNLGAPHVRGGEMKVSVTLNHAGRNYVLTTGQAPPPEVESWCALAAQAGFVLRRHMLLNFIDAQPRQRYDRLEPFLNLGTYLAIESALQTAASGSQLAVTTSDTQLRLKGQAIRTIFSLAPEIPIGDSALLTIINGALREAGVVEISSLADASEAEARINSELGAAGVDSRLASLHALKGQAQRLGYAVELKSLLDEVDVRSRALESEVTTRHGLVITEFLVRGREIIGESTLAECPLCEQSVDREALIARLHERIDADRRITAARVELNTAEDALAAAAKGQLNAMHAFISEWPKCIQTELPTQYQSTARVLEEIVAPRAAQLGAAEASDLIARLGATVSSHHPAVSVIDDNIYEAGGGEQRARLLSAKSMLTGVAQDWPEYKAAETNAKISSKKANLAARVHGHAVEARKATVQQLLDDVAYIANKYYEHLHPGEGVSASKLLIRPSEDGSVNISTIFYGKAVPPLLYLSESHLDTLGLCYFLALRRREADADASFRILMLDDVVHSVDARHRGRFVILLKENFSDHQIVITTHDTVFYQLLRQAFGQSGYVYLALNGWDVERGPLRGDPSTDLDRIVNPELRRSKSVDELAAAGGRFLEWMLREATEALEVAIPARFRGKHTIGTMWPPFAKKLRSQRYFAANYSGLTSNVEQTGWVRNEVGAHYNDPASPVDPEEVRAHAGHLAELHNALTCSYCGGFIRKHGDHDWRCPCARTAYPPVQAAEGQDNAGGAISTSEAR